jgi:hypothetical protein
MHTPPGAGKKIRTLLQNHIQKKYIISFRSILNDPMDFTITQMATSLHAHPIKSWLGLF